MWQGNMTLPTLPQKPRRYSGMKLLSMLLILGLAGFVVGRSFYWSFISDGYGYPVESCPSCGCNCSRLDESWNMALEEVRQAILPGCDKYFEHPDMATEGKLSVSKYQLMREALRLQETKAEDAEDLSQRALLIAEKQAAKYRKEVGKCLGGMMTTEKSRKKVEAALKLERETSTLWESRARALGWKDEEQRFKDNEDI